MKDPLTISNRQKQNALIKLLKPIKTEWSDTTTADYSISNKAAVLFLTVTYHRTYPEYIFERIKALKGSFDLRILLLLVNSENPDLVIQKLTIFCAANNMSVVLAFDYEEASRWLITLYDAQENNIEQLKATNETNYEIAVDALNSLGPSKKEAEMMLDSFHTLADCLLASSDHITNSIPITQSKANDFVCAVESQF